MKATLHSNRRQFVKAVWLSMALFVILTLLDYGFSGTLPSVSELGKSLAYTFVYTVVIYMANAFLFRAVARTGDGFSARSIISGVAASMVMSMGIVFVIRSIDAVAVKRMSFDDFLAKEHITNYFFFFIITLVITLSVYAITLYKAYQEHRVKEQKIIAGTASAQFESLKNQIDPHFLFNSLNVLSSLIEENQEMAQRFTTSLAKVYRYVLDQRNKELVPVEEELSFARTYMELLHMRFEDSITFELPTEIENPDGKVVPLSLQLLLENAVKHNVVSEKRPLHIRISIEANELVVENSLQKKEVLSERKGVGLRNIVERYAILTDRQMTIRETETLFSVRLPILSKLTFLSLDDAFETDTAYYRAKRRVEDLKGFYANLIAYCCIVPLLIYINLSYGPDFHWFWFPVCGWGMGLILHTFSIFGYGARWEERQIRKLLSKEQTRTWK
ncbi:MAG TPA: histidine kinase [Flavobacterium sp.]|nr:histidine kinase [Flavobacterium sp.]